MSVQRHTETKAAACPVGPQFGYRKTAQFMQGQFPY